MRNTKTLKGCRPGSFLAKCSVLFEGLLGPWGRIMYVDAAMCLRRNGISTHLAWSQVLESKHHKSATGSRHWI